MLPGILNQLVSISIIDLHLWNASKSNNIFSLCGSCLVLLVVGLIMNYFEHNVTEI